MRIVFKRAACQGHGRCYALAPALFDTDDDGYAVPLVGESDEVPAELEPKAQLCADNCPEYAIEVTA